MYFLVEISSQSVVEKIFNHYTRRYSTLLDATRRYSMLSIVDGLWT
jgi:hypothetical protein